MINDPGSRASAPAAAEGARSGNVGIAAPAPRGTRSHAVGVALITILVLVVIAGSLVPSFVIGWLRTEVPLFAVGWDDLDATFPAFNPLHVIFYAGLALGWRLVCPKWPRWRIPVILGAMGVALELLQFFSPHRQPRANDALDDWLGIAIGLGLAWMVRRWRRTPTGSRNA